MGKLDDSAAYNWKGSFSLALVSVQFAMQPFLTEAFVSRHSIKSSIVLIQEFVKSCCAVLLLCISGDLMDILKSWSFKNSIRVALLPAMIYCIQNVAIFYAYLQLDPLTFNLINQSKIIFAAIFLKIILNKTPSHRQFIALSLLFISSILISIDTTSSNNNYHQQCHTNECDSEKQATYGLIAIMTASVMSGLAGSLAQKALQSEQRPRNSYLFSFELAFYGIPFSFIRLYLEYLCGVLDGANIAKYGFFYDLQWTVLIPITVNAIGGIGVGLITKYTSVIHKSYALIFGILLSGIFRWILYAMSMSYTMYIAAPLVMLSLWLNVPQSTQSPQSPQYCIQFDMKSTNIIQLRQCIKEQKSKINAQIAEILNIDKMIIIQLLAMDIEDGLRLKFKIPYDSIFKIVIDGESTNDEIAGEITTKTISTHNNTLDEINNMINDTIQNGSLAESINHSYNLEDVPLITNLMVNKYDHQISDDDKEEFEGEAGEMIPILQITETSDV